MLTIAEAPEHPHNAARGSFVEIGGRRYAGSLSPYWVTIESGQVVLIEEQFLP